MELALNNFFCRSHKVDDRGCYGFTEEEDEQYCRGKNNGGDDHVSVLDPVYGLKRLALFSRCNNSEPARVDFFKRAEIKNTLVVTVSRLSVVDLAFHHQCAYGYA